MAEHLIDSLNTEFTDQLTALKDTADANADAVCGDTQRKWYLPPLGAWSGDPYDIPNTRYAFDRSSLNADYINVISDIPQRGRQGEAMILKLQLDYIIALERSFRTRQASIIRSKVHAGIRRKSHAASGGLYDTGNGTIVMWLTRLLDASHDP
jgi:hypothetical protein